MVITVKGGVLMLPTITRTGFTESEDAVLTDILEQSYTGLTNQQIADKNNISISSFYRMKKTEKFVNEILKQEKMRARALLPLAISVTEDMLTSDKTTDTAKASLIKMIMASNSLLKADDSKPVSNVEKQSENIEKLMIQYGIKKKAE